jgi:hypothetical protein
MIERIAGKRSLGLLILFFLIAFPSISHALCEATLEWDPSGSSAQGYYVFGREEGQDYDYDDPWWQGDNTFDGCTIDELEEDKTYFFVIRAYSGDSMSADSNEARFSYDDIADSDSAAPDNTSASLSTDATSDSTGSTFHGSSSGCFIGSIFDGLAKSPK